MSDKETILEILRNSAIEYEEDEDSSSNILTDSGVEFSFTKKGKLKSVTSIEKEEKPGASWDYYGSESDEDDDL